MCCNRRYTFDILLTIEIDKEKDMLNLCGWVVKGLYIGEYEVEGRCIGSRVTYGGTMQHEIKLHKTTRVTPNRIAKQFESVIVEDKDITFIYTKPYMVSPELPSLDPVF